jgi:hypothetical protein
MTELADGNEPLVLADGTKIDPNTGKVIKDESQKQRSYVEVPSVSDAQREVTRQRKRLADLPAPPKQMNAVSAVCFYRMMGLSDDEVAYATGLDEEQVGRLVMSELYTEVRNDIVKSILDQDAEDVRDMFAQNARNLANRLFDLANSDDEKVAIQAVNSGLDRAGHRPADVVHYKHSVEGGLTIEYVDRKSDDNTPTLDVEYTDVEDD